METRGRKGVTGTPGLFYFVLVVAITVAVVYMVNLVPFVEKIVSIRSEANFAVWQEDRGSGLAAFLASDTGEGSYAETLGYMAVDGVASGVDARLKSSLGKMQPNGRLELYYDSRLKKNYGSVGNDYLSADVALPGLKKGEVRVS